MTVLRINDVPAGPGGGRRVELTWDDGQVRRVAVSNLASQSADAELIRWYLEDYAEFPEIPAPARAQAAEAQLAEAGDNLFGHVFASRDAAGIWDRARDKLSEVRVEVDADPGQGPGLSWELLRDPDTGTPVALGAGEFVRTHLQSAGHPPLPTPAGDRLRVLLVIARPGGSDDVPFRSVASRLIRGGAGNMDGLDLDVLRPATFARLSAVLNAAYAAGRPYHIVHFDGHGDWLDVANLDFGENDDAAGAGGVSRHTYQLSMVGPVRDGSHGYLLFEDPSRPQNQQLVDGPSLARLLVASGVPVLVLNACRSGYAESRDRPDGSANAAPADDTAGLDGDVHSRIKAYGSLATEIADAGVPGVVAMRYIVYVVTAAQFVADLYAHLLAGQTLGRAATAARRALAADPTREVGAEPVSLQDWVVPIVYETAPLALLRPVERAVPLITLALADAPTADSGPGQTLGPDGLPRPPDAGFFGRDETLLALDRAFDTQRAVLLHAFAGAGKSSAATEFARWYLETGGLDDPDHPDWGPGPVLWSSFEHHLTADRVIGQAGDSFAAWLEANEIAWAAITDPAQRRDLVLQVLAQVPVLWIWDNVEPVAGFPEGTASDWTDAEQRELADLLRDLTQRTRCKVLLTSRRDERTWLGDLPARVRLPGMPMREAVQLAVALAARHGASLAGANWRSLLRYAAGNPLTITVLVGQALREHLATTEQIERFVGRLQAGEADLEPGEDQALGRTRSLAASLSYGFARAFTDAERSRLAVLHLFRDAVFVDVLLLMGNPEAIAEDAVPELAGLTYDAGIALLDRAASLGLVEPLGGGYYQVHPALPWYFAALFATAYGSPAGPAAQHVTRGYARAIGALGEYYWREGQQGRAAQVVGRLRTEEANLRHALGLSIAAGLWREAGGCIRGLRTLYGRTGRDGEWARLVDAVTPDFTDPVTGGPPPGREDQWSLITSYRVELVRAARDWPAAAALQEIVTAWTRDRAAEALAASPAGLTQVQRNQLRNLAVSLENLGHILVEQEDPSCLARYREGLALFQRIGDRPAEANAAGNLGIALLDVPGLRDLDQAERWFQHSLSLRDDDDLLGRAMNLNSLGNVAMEKFKDARASNHPEQVLLEHLNAALSSYQRALELTPHDDHFMRGNTEHWLGRVYGYAGDSRQALRHYQQSLQHKEARGDIYGAGLTRYNIAGLLESDDRAAEALLYARAALDNYRQAGPGAAADVADAEQFMADLEQRIQSPTPPTP